MEMWSMGVFGSYSSLEDLCHALDVPSPKNALHGSMVPRAFYDGRIDEICSYCNGDVLAMMKVYHKMTVLGTEKRNLNWIAPKESFA
jgi:predicted PolB exonuclease-like 3'-5' exonuclease